MNGKYITLISPDGGGKDTVFAELIKEYPNAIQMYEPGGTREADVIREMLLSPHITEQSRTETLKTLQMSKTVSEVCSTYLLQAIEELKKNGLTGKVEAYLYAASRAETNQKIVIPSLSKSKLILGRRSIACSMSYQGEARGLGMHKIWDLNQEAVQGAYPTLEIFIDVPAVVAQERIKGRIEKQDRLDKEKHDFHEKTVIGYHRYYQEFCPYPFIRIDGTQTKEEILSEVKKIVKNHLKTTP
ncbi:dTMP kinase [Priestia megaterium]|nr:dTMP kinase [Priestia megaterium]